MGKRTITVTRSYLVRRVQKVTIQVPDQGFEPDDGDWDQYLCDNGTFDLGAETDELIDDDKLEHDYTTIEKRARDLDKGDVFREFGMDTAHVVKKIRGNDDLLVRTRGGSEVGLDGDEVVEVYLSEPPHERPEYTCLLEPGHEGKHSPTEPDAEPFGIGPLCEEDPENEGVCAYHKSNHSK